VQFEIHTQKTQFEHFQFFKFKVKNWGRGRFVGLGVDLEATHQPFSRSLLGKSRSLFSLSVLSGEKGA